MFQFDADQAKNLRKLDKLMTSDRVPLYEIAEAVIATLYSLYFPASPENAAFDKFGQPLIAYIAILSLTPKGAPIPLSSLPVFLAKVQFSMRLRAYQHIYTRFRLSRQSLRHVPIPSPKGPGFPRVNKAKNVLPISLTEEGISSPSINAPTRRSKRLIEGHRPGDSSVGSNLHSSYFERNESDSVYTNDSDGESEASGTSSEERGVSTPENLEVPFTIDSFSQGNWEFALRTPQHSGWYQ